MRTPVAPLTRNEIHRRALLAAAAVALGTSSCGDAPSAAVSAADAQGSPDAAEVASATDTTVADTSGVDTGSADVTAAVDAAGKPDCKAGAAADLMTCCDALKKWCDDAFGADTEIANTCHFGPGFDASTGCTPWGPPAPPAWSAPDAVARLRA